MSVCSDASFEGSSSFLVSMEKREERGTEKRDSENIAWKLSTCYCSLGEATLHPQCADTHNTLLFHS